VVKCKGKRPILITNVCPGSNIIMDRHILIVNGRNVDLNETACFAQNQFGTLKGVDRRRGQTDERESPQEARENSSLGFIEAVHQ